MFYTVAQQDGHKLALESGMLQEKIKELLLMVMYYLPQGHRLS